MANQDTHSFFGENRSLFSDYYLRERLRDLPQWEQDISEPFRKALKIYRDKKSVLPGMNEAQTENEFVQPVLEQVLGFRFDVQKAEKKQGRTNIPDYIFFPDEESLKSAQQNRQSDSYYNKALALGDAKYWERPLDSKGVAEKDLYTNANPSFQIVNYLTVTGLEWGILTNGSRWRLYSTKARSRIDSYFEIDLKQILEEEDPEQFKYFYHFFRSEAFKKDPKTGNSFLERIFEGSIDYGSRLEKQLKDLIFEDVFLLMSRGFVEYRKEETDIQEETDESLDEIYQGTLRLLYRSLFLLHAESRGLLPLDNKGYLQYSLMELKKDIANRIDQDLPQSMRSFDVWNDLDSLFHIIDLGDPDLNVPRYNGGLFRQDHPNNRFLKEHKIADKYLVPALELLTRETDPNESGHKPFIDYKSLNVEQLGSIYEGLLEFHLRQSDAGEGGRKELFLENDKGERKATGSYYTPHYIVEYIVEHTLGPVFEERAATFTKLMEQLDPKYKTFQELDEKIAEGDRSEQIHNKRKAVNLEIASLEKKATEALLSLKICDPAMGSGHFLKEATDKLAEKIITLLAEYPVNPVTNLLEEIRSQILLSLEEQDITIDAEEHLKDTNLIKRMVMKRCIYGVDLNPMAVELAKLSLWLDSFTVGAPLSFLDHHLKTGNSLIGTTVGEIREQLETGQSHMFGGPFSGLLNATELMREVSVKTDATYSEVEQSIERYHDFEEAVKPYKKVLDIWLSRHFDNERAGDFLMTFSDQITHLLKGETVELGDKQQAIIDKAEQLNYEKHFFHWELEFPEVFVDLKQAKWLENPGFDAVVGNPPWGTEFSDTDKRCLSTFYEIAQYSTDSYAVFTELGIRKIRKNGTLGFITPDTYLRKDDFSVLRNVLVKQTAINEIIETGPLFPEVRDTWCLILLLTKKSPKEEHVVRHKQISRFIVSANERLKLFASKSWDRDSVVHQKHWQSRPNYRIGYLASDNEQKIIKKIESKASLLKDYNPQFEISRGEEGSKYDLITDESSDFKMVLPENVERHWVGNGTPISKEILTETKRRAYYEHPKIWVIRIQKLRWKQRIVAGLDERKSTAAMKTLQVIISKSDDLDELYFLNAVLNSKLLNYWCIDYLVDDMNQSYLEKLPIRSFKRESEHKINSKFRNLLTKDATKERVESIFINELNENSNSLVCYSYLIFLSKRIVSLEKERGRILNALDPFKFLNKGVKFKTFSDVFVDAIKYGEQLTDEVDIGTVHHDIEKLRLRPDGNRWVLSAQLKHRDPKTGWDDWIKEDKHTIVRTTHDIYRFELSDEEARYWQQAFEVLDEFENSGTFPGGKTRTTHEKLMKSEVPVFDESANIEPLIELREELAEVKEKIKKTDWLIDQVVYRLYGLSEEEIEVVEET